MSAAAAGDLRRIGILGGTLDPIHCGHLAAAVAARDAFDLSEVLVLPSRIPPHRAVQPLASPFHRFAMASLAVSGVPALFASDDELRLDGPSYTADTLERQHARGLAAIADFLHYRRRRVRGYRDLEALSRGPRPRELHRRLAARAPHRRAAVAAAGARGSDAAVAAGLRTGAGGGDPLIYLLQAPTPEVSSTAVRDRLRRGEGISGMVPRLVETHILQHRLYSK